MSQTVEVKLYSNSSDPFVVHKKITLKTTVYCQITDEMPIDSPVLLLDMQSGIKDFNYAYIEDFGRYYFCEAEIVNGNQMRLNCVSDPLMSFWGSFKTSMCVAERSTSARNSELVDEMLPFKSQPTYITRKIGLGFSPSTTGGCYILTVGGK